MNALRPVTLAPAPFEPERPLALAGLMGAGKSTVGRLAASALGRPFVDLDAEVEREAGRSVAEVFAAEGEAAFRERESRALLRALSAPAATAGAVASPEAPRPPVIALGGGAVLAPANRALLCERACVVWLRAQPWALAARLVAESGTGAPARPLLAGAATQAEVASRLATLLDVRCAAYEEVADRALNVDLGPAEGAADLVVGIGRGRRVRVDLGERSHDVVVEAGALAHLGRLVRRALPRPVGSPPRCALVVDRGLPLEAVELARDSLASVGLEGPLVTLPAGEPAKRLSEVERILEALVEGGLDRGSVVVALGGGACTDAAGLAAALLARGVAWVAVPTTLLGMVDAAIGGKTAVDLSLGKNLAGAFHQPRLVVADPLLLRTLPPREWASGLGEVVKYGLIGPRAAEAAAGSLVARLAAGSGSVEDASRDPATVDAIALSAAIKAGVVSRDERETLGERKTLNFGHTIGHAFEAAMGGRLPHGSAVLHGMRAALHLSHAKGLLPEDEHARALALIAGAAPPPLDAALDPEALLAYVLRDKKFAQGRMLFVLLEGVGRPVVDVEVTRAEALAAIAFAREESGREGRAPKRRNDV